MMPRLVFLVPLAFSLLLASCSVVADPMTNTPDTRTVPTSGVSNTATPTPAPTADVPSLILRAEVIDPIHYGVEFTATVVGGPDNNRDLGCPSQDWQFGDGQSWGQVFSCVAPPDTIERVYKRTYYYRGPGAYTASFTLNKLFQATVTVHFPPLAIPTSTATPDPAVPRLEVRADPVFIGGFAIRFTAVIVGGPDRNPDLACASVFWDFGDGQAYVTERRCEPGTLDAPMRRVFEQTHAYRVEGGYEVTVQIGTLHKRLVGYTPLTIEPPAPTPTPRVPPFSSHPTPDSVRAAYDAWPAEYKHCINEDIVVRFPYPCDVCMWAGMAFMITSPPHPASRYAVSISQAGTMRWAEKTLP